MFLRVSNLILFVNLRLNNLIMSKGLVISDLIKGELNQFTAYYRNSISSENPRIQEIIDHIMNSQGKHIRPLLLLLSAKACGEVNQVTYDTAITVELIHTASLIHDDVVDESKLRRGKPSVNAIFDNKMAVLVGDYFLSTSLIKAALIGNLEIITYVSQLGRVLADGELNQLYLVKKSIVNKDEYFDVIKKKTASLISTCMRLGAISVGASREVSEEFARLGEIVGMCFQMRDDIFDYFSDDVGKPTGNDIREGKITLPLLHAIEVAREEDRKRILDIIEADDFSDQNVEMLIDYAKDNGGIEYTYSVIDEYKTEAESLLYKIENEAVRAEIKSVLDYIVERKY